MAAGDGSRRSRVFVDSQHRNSLVGPRASLVQAYTAGLRWETEPMVVAAGEGISDPLAWHRLPPECPLKPPADHHGLWTALWQAACLLRPEVPPARWRSRIRRLARVAGELVYAELEGRMAEWVRRLLPSSKTRATDVLRPGMSISESTVLDLQAVEACRCEGGVVLLAWQRWREPTLKSQAEHPHDSRIKQPDDHWQWRVVAGLEGFERKDLGGKGSQERGFDPRSALLLPQEAEAVWGCGYGMRLDPAASLGRSHPTSGGPWRLRSLDGALTAVEVVRVLMLRPDRQ